jgi:PIN domain nuclease of toxin-antitoxin system
MKVLFDTCTLLWASGEPDRLSATARKLIGDAANTRLLSAASVWEIAIKTRVGRLDLASPPERFVADAMVRLALDSLPILQAHALRAGALPDHHRDPFDRMLVAQAQLARLPILTPDRAFKPYGVKLIW